MKVRSPALVLLVLSVLVSWSQPARGDSGFDVDDPGNLWAPYGSRAANLRLSFYSNELSEFNDFELGRLDITDSTQPASKFSPYDENPDFVLSPGQGQYGMFGIDYNYGSSTWAAWGCGWQHGTSACGIEIREGFAHLVDRDRFVTDGPLGGAGQAIMDPSPPAKDPAGSSLPDQNSWDTLAGKTVAGMTHPSTVGAFHIAPSPGGFAAPGSPDFCAARDHVIAAGIGLRDDDFDCTIDGNSPGLATILAHPIRFMIRSDDPNLKALGQGLITAINQLFGASVVAPTFGSIVQLRPTVFVSAPNGPTDDWDMYTMSWSRLAGPFPDHLRPFYGGAFASNQCGGPVNGQTLNYGFVCLPTFDVYADAAAQTADISDFNAQTLNALNQLGRHAANLPVFASGIRIAALRSVAGLVNQRGVSYPNFWTTLNAHNDTSHSPVDPRYKFGGGTNTIRWGQKQGTSQLNIFNVQTLWEFNVIYEIYDNLLRASPIEPTSILCWMCNTYSTYADAQGNTHILIVLRQNLRWHDGVPVNASDIKFTLLNLRDVPAAALSSNVQFLSEVTILNPLVVDIKMQGQSISHLVNLAGVPIIPRHIWELQGDRKYGDVGKADPTKTSASYDPVQSGTLIGSGPYMCRSVFPEDVGRIGTGCIISLNLGRGGQSIPAGSSMILQTFDRTGEPLNTDPFLQYARSYNSAWGTNGSHSGQFQEFSWADKFDNATVTILDLADVAVCFGKSSPLGCPGYNYWLRPAFHPNTPDTISSEVAIVAAHLDDTWVSPFSWSGVQTSQPGQLLDNLVLFTP